MRHRRRQKHQRLPGTVRFEEHEPPNEAPIYQITVDGQDLGWIEGELGQLSDYGEHNWITGYRVVIGGREGLEPGPLHDIHEKIFNSLDAAKKAVRDVYEPK